MNTQRISPPTNLQRAATFLPGLLPRERGDGWSGETAILTHLSDPGHGWLVVPRALVADVLGPFGGMGLVSAYSYEVPTHTGPVMLLEEDQDASLFAALWEKQSGLFGPFTIANVECPDSIDVRALPRFTGSNPALGSAAWEVVAAHYRERASRPQPPADSEPTDAAGILAHVREVLGNLDRDDNLQDVFETLETLRGIVFGDVARDAERLDSFDRATGEKVETFPDVRGAMARLQCGLEGKDVPGVEHYDGILYDAAKEMAASLKAANLID